MKTPHLLDADLQTLTSLLASRQLRAQDLVEAYISQIGRVNPVLNCVVQDRFELARLEARQADAALDAGTATGRLAGIPLSIKDCLDVKGLPTTGGLAYRQAVQIDADADVVARLRAAGAIILAKTNMPTLGMCQETDNKLFGRTNNPWDLTRTPGGSSGGEAALLAVGGIAAGFGSDIGGSIRFPAHFTGVVGFKAGANAVSLGGHFPEVADDRGGRMLGIGPLTRTVADARLLYEIVANSPMPVVAAESYRLVLPDAHPHFPLGPAVKDALAHAKRLLNAEGGALPPGFAELPHLWQLAMAWDGGLEATRLSYGEAARNPWPTYMRERLRGDTELHEFILWTLVGMGLFKPTASQRASVPARLDAAALANEEYLADKVLVLPVYQTPARPHGELYHELFSVLQTYKRLLPYVVYVNALGLPALTVPVGEVGGLPVGLQVVGRRGMEHAIFEVGERLAAGSRGYRRCDFYDAR